MPATLFASGAWDIGDSAACINNKSENLRWRPDPKPRRVIPIIKIFKLLIKYVHILYHNCHIRDL